MGDLSNATYVQSVITAALTNPVYREVSGDFGISARFCEPAKTVHSRRNTVQLLVHGFTYSKDYWSALAFPGYQPNHYSWIEYASNEGYPTLSIDRLGSGLSSHPDPVSVVQLPLEVNIINEIVLGVKNGSILNQPFSKVVYVGHSFASCLGNAIIAQYPKSCNAFILTGYSANLADAPLLTKPACEVSIRFSKLSPGYQATFNATNRQGVLYGPVGTFDSEVFSLDFRTQDTITVGQAATIGMGFQTGPNYTGPVHIISGAKDAVFCNDADCGSGATSQLGATAKFFPASSSFSYYAVPDTGHDINLQYSARESFNDAHTWLQKQGF
jgi:pimeloyl-ACP methyl ester carboxylesterase